MADWQAAFATGFGNARNARRYHDAYVTESRRGPSGHDRLHHVGYLNNTPVACSMLLIDGPLATVWDLATAPEHRRRGCGAALVRTLLDEAISAGCRHASLNSSPLGASLYRALGFDLEVAIPQYDWTSPVAAHGHASRPLVR